MFIFAALKKIAFVVLWKTVEGNQSRRRRETCKRQHGYPSKRIHIQMRVR